LRAQMLEAGRDRDRQSRIHLPAGGALGKSTSAAEFIVFGPTPPEKQNGKLGERDSKNLIFATDR
jgi:hypothetical protein